MLRIGLTGGLGSGKSAVAAMFAARGAHLLEADAIGRELMQPGQPVYAAILQYFAALPDAPALLRPDGQLNRAALAQYVFAPQGEGKTGRIDALSRIVHPPVIAEQERRAQEIFARDSNAIVMVESALIFEADRAGTAPGLSRRFDQLVLVAAPETLRIARTVDRVRRERERELRRGLNPAEISAIEEDTRRRIAAQIPDVEKIPRCDYVIDNSGPLEQTEAAVERIMRAWRT